MDGNLNLARGDYVLAIILRGRDGMPAFHGRLSEAEVLAVADHLRTGLRNDFGPVEARELTMRWWRGAEDTAQLYGRVCARCHGAEGGGGMGPAFVANDNLSDPQYVVGKILHGQGGMPAFEGMLGPETVAGVANYIRNAFGNDFGEVGQGLARNLQTPPTRKAGGLQITLTPAGTRLSIIGPDGYRRYVSRATSESLEGLVAGVYTVSATKSGYRALNATVEVLPGLLGLVTLTLDPIPTPQSKGRPTGSPQVGSRQVSASEEESPPAAGDGSRLRYRQRVLESVAQGGQQWYVRSCAACHGPEGGGGVGPPLAGNGRLQSAEFVLQRILRGSERMPPFAHRLSDRQIAAIASHERTSWGHEFGEVDKEQVAQQRQAEGPTERSATVTESGGQIYHEYCAICHGGAGGGGVGPAFRGNPVLADLPYTTSRIVMGGGGMPAFNEVLSSTDTAEVATFIRNSWGNHYGPVATSQAQDYHGGASSLNP